MEEMRRCISSLPRLTRDLHGKGSAVTTVSTAVKESMLVTLMVDGWSKRVPVYEAGNE